MDRNGPSFLYIQINHILLAFEFNLSMELSKFLTKICCIIGNQLPFF